MNRIFRPEGGTNVVAFKGSEHVREAAEVTLLRTETVLRTVAYHFSREYDVQEGKLVKRKNFRNVYGLLLTYLASQIGESRCPEWWYDKLCVYILVRFVKNRQQNSQDLMPVETRRALAIVEAQDVVALQAWYDGLMEYAPYYQETYAALAGGLREMMHEEGFREGDPDWDISLEALKLVFLARLTPESMMRDYSERASQPKQSSAPTSPTPQRCTDPRSGLKLME